MRFGLGHNASTLNPLQPQPRYAGLQYGRQRYTPTGMVEDAPYAELVFVGLTPREMDLLMGALDLKSNTARDITIELPEYDRTTYKKYNGTALRPTNAYANPLWREVIVIVRDLVAV